MFPKDAHFICRKCLHRFFFKDEDFKTMQGFGLIKCPQCDLMTPEKSKYVSAFFKYYPWFTSFISVMGVNGFKPKSFAVQACKDKSGPEYYRMIDFVSICQECGKPHRIDLEQIDLWSRDLYCRDCGAKPIDRDYVKAFFHYFIKIHEAQIKIQEFQSDIFSQSQLHPKDLQIQDTAL